MAEIFGTIASALALLECINGLKKYVHGFKNAHEQFERYQMVLESIHQVRFHLSLSA